MWGRLVRLCHDGYVKVVEFQSTLAPGGGLEVPEEIASEIPAGEQVRVLVMWDAADPDGDWRSAGRRTFEAAYSPEDAVYEKLMDHTQAG